jgi:hypothetical protein
MVAVCLSVAGPASAQRSLGMDPGVRGAGMGGAVTADFWTGDADTWANPALLGYRDGLRYTFGRTSVLPELTNDIIYRTHQLSAGWSGVGVGFSSLTLDFGESQGTDPNGNPTGTFHAHETTRVFGLGASLGGVVAALRGDAEPPGLLRYVDLAVGGTVKRYTIDLGPVPNGQTHTDTGDWGTTVRVSPLPQGSRGAFVDVAYAYAVLDYKDAFVGFPGEPPIATPRLHRNGFAVRFGLPASEAARQSLPGWLGGGVAPLVSVAVAGDFVSTTDGDVPNNFDETHIGMEADLLGLLALRVGHVTDEQGIVEGMTFGFGLGVPVGEWGGIRYDFASVPQEADLDRLTRHAIGAYVDPLAAYQAMRGR